MNRAFARADKKLKTEKNDALKRAAQPVSDTAERLAVSSISRIGPVWSQMRIGVTQKIVYVAPATRTKTRQRRRKFGTRLIEEAMIPALHQNRERVVRELDEVLRTVGRDWER